MDVSALPIPPHLTQLHYLIYNLCVCRPPVELLQSQFPTHHTQETLFSAGRLFSHFLANYQQPAINRWW